MSTRAYKHGVTDGTYPPQTKTMGVFPPPKYSPIIPPPKSIVPQIHGGNTPPKNNSGGNTPPKFVGRQYPPQKNLRIFPIMQFIYSYISLSYFGLLVFTSAKIKQLGRRKQRIYTLADNFHSQS